MDFYSTSLRWKIPAARAAEAFVFSKTSEKWSTAPAPLLAITGMVTESDISFIRSMSKPFPWPAHHKFSLMASTCGIDEKRKQKYGLWQTLFVGGYVLPSQSMQLSSISPAPSSSTALANSYAPIGRPSRPPLTWPWFKAWSATLQKLLNARSFILSMILEAHAG